MSDYMILGMISVGVCLLMATMFISSRFHYSIKAIASIIVVVACIYNWELFASTLGFPVNLRPPNNSHILYTSVKKEQKKVFLLVDGPIPRTYTIPYSEPLEKRLGEAKKQMEQNKGEGRLVYKVKIPQKQKNGKSKDAKGKQTSGQQEEQNQNETEGQENADESFVAKIKEQTKDFIKKSKEILNISDDGSEGSELDWEGKKRKDRMGTPQIKDFEGDETINDDIQFESNLPKK